MKSKTKKILAGLGLGVVGAMTLTGCASDIVFNQADLDNVISGVNEYLEYQNNYSSEYATNMLNDLLIKSKFDLISTNGYIVSLNQTIMDRFGNVEENSFIKEQIYKVQDKYKYLYEANDGNESLKVYTLIEREDNAYTKFSYNLNDNSYVKTTQQGDADLHVAQFDPNDMIDLIFQHIYSENLVGEVILDKLGDNYYEFKFIYKVESNLDEEVYGYSKEVYNEYWSVKFRNNTLEEMKQMITANFDNGKYISSALGNASFVWDARDIIVDTSNCVEISNEE